MKRNLTLALILLLLFSMAAGCAPVRRPYDGGQAAYYPPATQPVADTTQIPEQSTPLVSSDAVVTYPTPDPDMISQQLAMDIALLHAGVTADEAEFLQIEFDIDDRVPQFEVQFYVNRMEYEYEIHAKTGEILYFEQDYD